MKNKDYKQTFSTLDAFLALEDVEDDEITLPLNEGKSYSIYNEQEMEDAAEFRAKDEKEEDSVLEVIDVDADTIEKIKDPKSYIGQMLLQCNSCKSTRFIDVDALKVSEIDNELYNEEDECPHCHNVGVGYTLIGQVGKTPEQENEAPLDNDQVTDEAGFDNDVEDTEVSDKVSQDLFDEVAAEPTEETKSDDEESTYDETDAEDDTEDMDTPKLGDEVDSDDVKADDTEEPEEEEEDKTKKESLEESYDPLTLDELVNKYRYDYNETNHEHIWREVEAEYGEEIANDVLAALEDESYLETEMPMEEDLDLSTWEGSIANLLSSFTIDDQPIQVRILTKNGEEIDTYQSDELPFSAQSEMIDTFNTDDKYINISVEREGQGTRIIDLFSNYRADEYNETIFLVEDLDDEEEYEFSSIAELLDQFGDYYISGNIECRTLNIFIHDTSLETEVKEYQPKTENESLIEQIINLNPRLRLNRINNTSAEEYFISESIKYKEDLDKVYDKYIAPYNETEVAQKFKQVTGYRTAIDNIMEKYNIDIEGYRKFIASQQEAVETQVADKHLYASVKNRKELSEKLQTLKENNIEYQVKKSNNNEFRYDIFLNEGAPLFPAEQEVPVEVIPDENIEVLDSRPEVSTTDVVPADMDARDVEVVTKIMRIASDIANAVSQHYHIEADPRLIVADIMCDLQLVGGKLNPNDLPDTPINQLTKKMYADFNGFFDAIDKGISFFTGRRFSSNAEQRLMMAIKSLDSEQFSTETINKMIGSTRFLQAAQSGMIPYINANQLSAPEEQLSEDDEVEFDNERFDERVMEFFEESYNETLIYRTLDGSIDQNKNIHIRGVVESEDNAKEINFTLTPRLNESNNNKIEYVVTNDISEEIFILESR